MSRQRAWIGSLLLVSVVLIVCGHRAIADEPSLSIRVAIGTEEFGGTEFDPDGELLLNKPSHVVWSHTGIAYVLNKDCTVVAFDPDWQFLFRFGGRGEGPGECFEPRGLLVGPTEICIVGRTRLAKYDLAGKYLENVPLDPRWFGIRFSFPRRSCALLKARPAWP